MTEFVLAHLSDPHLGPIPKPRVGELVGKRAFGYLNWARNRAAHHAPHVVETLVADIKAQKPDHIAITGDLVNIGLPDEFALARRWLNSVGSPGDVTLVPGNHDCYVAATQHFFLRAWADYLHGDGSTTVTFPFVRRRGPLALIGLSTAVPTAPLMATGRLGRSQAEALSSALASLAGEDRFRVLLIHHPPVSSRPARYKRLTDAKTVLDIIRTHGVDLILHGHDHRHSLSWIEGPSGRIASLGVPSASAVAHGHGEPASYNLIRVNRADGNWQCELTVRGLRRDRPAIAELQRQRLK